MDNLLEVFKYFDWVVIAMVSIATSLALSVVNRVKGVQQLHDSLLILIIAGVFTALLTNFTRAPEETLIKFIQALVFQYLLTVMVAYLFAVSKGQAFVDSLLGYAGNYVGKFFQRQEKKLDEDQKPPQP